MKHTTAFFLIFLFAISVVLQWQCRRAKNDSVATTQKFATTDPFSQSGVTSQFFEIKSGESSVLQGVHGTRLAISENCFLDENGKPAKGNIKIELAEALDLQNMIQSNLTTTSNGQPIITDGMIYFNATLDGKQLFIDEHNPVYIEIPTAERKSGMMIYKGERDENGNMNWVNPREPENYLIPVDINLLNFYPEGFEDEVEAGMPFGNHAVATKELKDSLYYSMENFRPYVFETTNNALIQNEPYYNQRMGEAKSMDTSVSIPNDSAAHCGIEPSRIKAIKTDQFQNTIIATREFETRLKTIFKTCNDQVLDLYVSNLDKNLWEIDEKVYQLLGEQSQYAGSFKSYADQKLTKVNSNKSAMLLKDYYNKELLKIRDELNGLQRDADEALKKHEQVTQQLVAQYKEVLKKRESYRMQTYGFTMTATGWVNVDTGTIPKWWGSEKLEMAVENSNQMDRVYSYVIYPGIKSLYRLNSDDGKNFYAGNSNDHEMLMPKSKPAVVIVIGYKDQTPFFSVVNFITSVDHELKSAPEETTKQKMEDAIAQYEFSKENSIATDLEYQAKLYTEKKWIEKQEHDQRFLMRLYDLVFPCCAENNIADGKILFNTYCFQCHKGSPFDNKLVGPPLNQSTSKHSMSWLIQWTRNNGDLRNQGDSDAIRIWKEYGKNEEPAFESLSAQQIKAIYSYIDSEKEIVSH